MSTVRQNPLKFALSYVGFASIVLFGVDLIAPDNGSFIHDLWPWLGVYVAAGCGIVIWDVIWMIATTKQEDAPALLLLRPYVFDLFFPFAIVEFPFNGIIGEIRYRRQRKQTDKKGCERDGTT